MNTITVVLVFVVVIMLAYLAMRWRVGNGSGIGPPGRGVLDAGWQLYLRPTTLEPPGTIFRIDENQHRFIVERLPIKRERGAEAQGRHYELRAARMDMIARFFDISGAPRLQARARKTESHVFDLDQPLREYVEDADLDRALEAHEIDRRPNNRYFIIRETLSAQKITFIAEGTQVEELGGKAALAGLATVGGTGHGFSAKEQFVLDKTFDVPYRVMFLPEELRLPSADQATHRLEELNRQGVDEPLEWIDSRETELDFVIDELLTPLARLFGPRWLGAVERQVPAQLRVALRRFVDSNSAPAAGDLQGDVREARAELVHHVVRSAGAGSELWDDIAQPDVAVEPDADDDVKLLESYFAKLLFTLDRVQRLGKPVALRGFFNSTNCVTVVDCRSDDRYLTLPDRPTPRSASNNFEPSISLTPYPSAIKTAAEKLPRVWLIRTETEQERDKLAAELREQLSRPASQLAGILDFDEKELPNSPSPVLVASIDKDLVHTASENRHVLRSTAAMVREALDKDANSHQDRFYDIDGRAGIDLLLDDLVRRLRENWERNLEWL